MLGYFSVFNLFKEKQILRLITWILTAVRLTGRSVFNLAAFLARLARNLKIYMSNEIAA